MPKPSSSAPQLRRKFNLLKPQLAPPTAWDRIYDWLTTRARLVILICEFIIIVCFVAKVVVDIQAKNLNDELAAKSLELTQYASTVEPQLRDIQQRALTYEKVWAKSSHYSEILREVHNYLTNPGADISVTFNGELLTIRGGDALTDLQQIEARMKASPTFTGTQLALNTEGSDVGAGQGQYEITAKIVTLASRTELKSTKSIVQTNEEPNQTETNLPQIEINQ